MGNSATSGGRKVLGLNIKVFIALCLLGSFVLVGACSLVYYFYKRENGGPDLSQDGDEGEGDSTSKDPTRKAIAPLVKKISVIDISKPIEPYLLCQLLDDLRALRDKVSYILAKGGLTANGETLIADLDSMLEITDVETLIREAETASKGGIFLSKQLLRVSGLPLLDNYLKLPPGIHLLDDIEKLSKLDPKRSVTFDFCCHILALSAKEDFSLIKRTKELPKYSKEFIAAIEGSGLSIKILDQAKRDFDAKKFDSNELTKAINSPLAKYLSFIPSFEFAKVDYSQALSFEDCAKLFELVIKNEEAFKSILAKMENANQKDLIEALLECKNLGILPGGIRSLAEEVDLSTFGVLRGTRISFYLYLESRTDDRCAVWITEHNTKVNEFLEETRREFGDASDAILSDIKFRYHEIIQKCPEYIFSEGLESDFTRSTADHIKHLLGQREDKLVKLKEELERKDQELKFSLELFNSDFTKYFLSDQPSEEELNNLKKSFEILKSSQPALKSYTLEGFLTMRRFAIMSLIKKCEEQKKFTIKVELMTTLKSIVVKIPVKPGIGDPNSLGFTVDNYFDEYIKLIALAVKELLTINQDQAQLDVLCSQIAYLHIALYPNQQSIMDFFTQITFPNPFDPKKIKDAIIIFSKDELLNRIGEIIINIYDQNKGNASQRDIPIALFINSYQHFRDEFSEIDFLPSLKSFPKVEEYVMDFIFENSFANLTACLDRNCEYAELETTVEKFCDSYDLINPYLNSKFAQIRVHHTPAIFYSSKEISKRQDPQLYSFFVILLENLEPLWASPQNPQIKLLLNSSELIYWLLADNIDFKNDEWNHIYHEINETRIHYQSSQRELPFSRFLHLHYFNQLEHNQISRGGAEVSKYFKICKLVEAHYRELLETLYKMPDVSNPDYDQLRESQFQYFGFSFVRHYKLVEDYSKDFGERFKRSFGENYHGEISSDNHSEMQSYLLSKFSLALYPPSGSSLSEAIRTFYAESYSLDFRNFRLYTTALSSHLASYLRGEKLDDMAGRVKDVLVPGAVSEQKIFFSDLLQHVVPSSGHYLETILAYQVLLTTPDTTIYKNALTALRSLVKSKGIHSLRCTFLKLFSYEKGGDVIDFKKARDIISGLHVLRERDLKFPIYNHLQFLVDEFNTTILIDDFLGRTLDPLYINLPDLILDLEVVLNKGDESYELLRNAQKSFFDIEDESLIKLIDNYQVQEKFGGLSELSPYHRALTYFFKAKYLLAPQPGENIEFTGTLEKMNSCFVTEPNHSTLAELLSIVGQISNLNNILCQFVEGINEIGKNPKLFDRLIIHLISEAKQPGLEFEEGKRIFLQNYHCLCFYCFQYKERVDNSFFQSLKPIRQDLSDNSLLFLFKHLISSLASFYIDELRHLPSNYITNKLIDDENFVFINETEYFKMDDKFMANCSIVLDLNRKLKDCKSFLELRDTLGDFISSLLTEYEAKVLAFNSQNPLDKGDDVRSKLVDESLKQIGFLDILDSVIGFRFEYPSESSDSIVEKIISLNELDNSYPKSSDRNLFPTLREGDIIVYCEADRDYRMNYIAGSIRRLEGRFKDNFKSKFLNHVKERLFNPVPFSLTYKPQESEVSDPKSCQDCIAVFESLYEEHKKYNFAFHGKLNEYFDLMTNSCESTNYKYKNFLTFKDFIFHEFDNLLKLAESDESLDDAKLREIDIIYRLTSGPSFSGTDFLCDHFSKEFEELMKKPDVQLRNLLNIKEKCNLTCNRYSEKNAKFFAADKVEFVYLLIQKYHKNQRETCLNLARQLTDEDFSSSDALIEKIEWEDEYLRILSQFENFEGDKFPNINQVLTNFQRKWDECRLLSLRSPFAHPSLAFNEFKDYIELILNGLFLTIEGDKGLPEFLAAKLRNTHKNYLQLWNSIHGTETFKYPAIDLKQKLDSYFSEYIKSYEKPARRGIENHIMALHFFCPLVFGSLRIPQVRSIMAELLEHAEYQTLIQKVLCENLVSSFMHGQIEDVMETIYKIDSIKDTSSKAKEVKILREVVDFESAVTFYLKQVLADQITQHGPEDPGVYLNLANLLSENKKPNVIECLKKYVDKADFFASFSRLSELIVDEYSMDTKSLSLYYNYEDWYRWMLDICPKFDFYSKFYFFSPLVFHDSLLFYEAYFAFNLVEFKKIRAIDLFNFELLINEVDREKIPYLYLLEKFGIGDYKPKFPEAWMKGLKLTPVQFKSLFNVLEFGFDSGISSENAVVNPEITNFISKFNQTSLLLGTDVTEQVRKRLPPLKIVYSDVPEPENCDQILKYVIGMETEEPSVVLMVLEEQKNKFMPAVASNLKSCSVLYERYLRTRLFSILGVLTYIDRKTELFSGKLEAIPALLFDKSTDSFELISQFDYIWLAISDYLSLTSNDWSKRHLSKLQELFYLYRNVSQHVYLQKKFVPSETDAMLTMMKLSFKPIVPQSLILLEIALNEPRNELYNQITRFYQNNYSSFYKTVLALKNLPVSLHDLSLLVRGNMFTKLREFRTKLLDFKAFGSKELNDLADLAIIAKDCDLPNLKFLGFFIEINSELDKILADSKSDTDPEFIIRQKISLALSDISPSGIIHVIEFLIDHKEKRLKPLVPMLVAYAAHVQFSDDDLKFSEFVQRHLKHKLDRMPPEQKVLHPELEILEAWVSRPHDDALKKIISKIFVSEKELSKVSTFLKENPELRLKDQNFNSHVLTLNELPNLDHLKEILSFWNWEDLIDHNRLIRLLRDIYLLTPSSIQASLTSGSIDLEEDLTISINNLKKTLTESRNDLDAIADRYRDYLLYSYLLNSYKLKKAFFSIP